MAAEMARQGRFRSTSSPSSRLESPSRPTRQSRPRASESDVTAGPDGAGDSAWTSAAWGVGGASGASGRRGVAGPVRPGVRRERGEGRGRAPAAPGPASRRAPPPRRPRRPAAPAVAPGGGGDRPHRPARRGLRRRLVGAALARLTPDGFRGGHPGRRPHGGRPRRGGAGRRRHPPAGGAGRDQLLLRPLRGRPGAGRRGRLRRRAQRLGGLGHRRRRQPDARWSTPSRRASAS